MKRLTTLALAGFVSLALAAGATAAQASLFGAATKQGSQVRLVSDFSNASTADDASGIAFSNLGLTRFSSLTHLSTRFNVTDDDCGGGSPRFQLNVGGKNVFVYLGPSPTFTGCAPNTLLDSGNLIGNNDPCRWDTSQIQAGTQCNTYVGTLALIGSMQVTGIQLVVDSGWFFADKEQTVLVCGVRINRQTFFLCRGARPPAAGREKITICHHTHGMNGTKHVTIRISKNAWTAHQRHGDTLGACTNAQARKAHSRAAHAKKFHKKRR